MSLIDELREKFPGLVGPLVAESPREVLIALESPDIRPVVDFLRTGYESRLVAVFAEDRVASEGVFYNYYVFEKRGEPGYLLFRDAHPRRPAAPSLR